MGSGDYRLVDLLQHYGLLIKLRRTCYKGDGRVERILEEIAPNSGISIRYTDLVDTPFLVCLLYTSPSPRDRG